MTNLPPKNVLDEVWDFVDQFICPIHLIPIDDTRKPPGDHHGTGWFIKIKGQPHLCTCEHVAKDQAAGTLGYAPTGSNSGVSVGSEFSLFSHPVDFAIANLSNTWNAIKHSGKIIPPMFFDQKHKPVTGEYLYLQGFPGADSKPLFEQHNGKGLGAYLHEVVPPDKFSRRNLLSKLVITYVWRGVLPTQPHSQKLQQIFQCQEG